MPQAPWAVGGYELRVATELEDVAGNNLHRLFDVDLSRTTAAGDGPAPRVRAFTISKLGTGSISQDREKLNPSPIDSRVPSARLLEADPELGDERDVIGGD